MNTDERPLHVDPEAFWVLEEIEPGLKLNEGDRYWRIPLGQPLCIRKGSMTRAGDGARHSLKVESADTPFQQYTYFRVNIEATADLREAYATDPAKYLFHDGKFFRPARLHEAADILVTWNGVISRPAHGGKFNPESSTNLLSRTNKMYVLIEDQETAIKLVTKSSVPADPIEKAVHDLTAAILDKISASR